MSPPRRIALDLRGLSGREDMWRFTGALRRNPAVDAWLTAGRPELQSIAQKWFGEMRECGDDVRDLMHDGCPVACVHDAAFGYVNSFTRHVNVGFFYGAELKDPAGLLEGSGRRMRHVKLGPERDVDVASLRKLIEAAYTDVKRRLKAR